jgi:hypothetical protein
MALDTGIHAGMTAVLAIMRIVGIFFMRLVSREEPDRG